MRNYEKILDSLKNIDLKNKLKPMLPYFITIISGVTTYFLYSYFNRDIVKIQSVSVRPKEISLTVDRQFATKLSSVLSNELIQNGSINLTTINKDYIFETIKYLGTRSGTFADKIAEQTRIKNQINDVKNDSVSKDDVANIDNFDNRLFDYYDENDDLVYGFKKKISKQQILEKINFSIEKYTKAKNEIDEVIKSLAQKTKKALDDNKDKFQIEIIAFNEGNQQTVIRNKGNLLIGQTLINLKKASTFKIEDYYSKLSKAITGKYSQDGSSSNYLIIEPKSFIVMNLEIDVFNNKNRDTEVIKREYLSGQSKVELTLFDIKNSPIKPFSFLLQNDIEFDPNEELSKCLSPFIEE